jgi:putative membrane protein
VDPDFHSWVMHRYLMRVITSVVALAISPAIAAAHTGRALAPHDLWYAWSWEPLVLIGLAASAWLYATGLVRLWSNGVGAGIRVWEAVSFAGGWAVLAIALVSPLHALGGVLFSAHMAQHELLIAVSAPLLVLGRPLIPFLFALPLPARRTLGKWTKTNSVARVWQALTLPSVAFALHAIALWAWHLPGPYQSTLHSELMHSLQHSSFLFSALLFWWTIFKVRGSDLGYGGAVLYLFGTGLQTGALGALLTFAPTLWYPAYAATTGPWGLTPLEDQQLGGLIMWIPGSIPYLVAGLAMFARWLAESEKRSVRHTATMTSARVAVLIIVLLGLSACDRASGDDRYHLAAADPDRGRVQIRRYGCGSCHSIPGIVGAAGMVGPPLANISQRVFIAGVLPNEPDNMVKWIQNPQGVDPKTAMPNMGVTTQEARDIAAYLYTLR